METENYGKQFEILHGIYLLASSFFRHDLKEVMRSIDLYPWKDNYPNEKWEERKSKKRLIRQIYLQDSRSKQNRKAAASIIVVLKLWAEPCYKTWPLGVSKYPWKYFLTCIIHLYISY